MRRLKLPSGVLTEWVHLHLPYLSVVDINIDFCFRYVVPNDSGLHYNMTGKRQFKGGA